ncbi:hypothetical protein BTUL_0078g00500 [Botrytis tulipae]|uniref:Tyrosinase copper-binding domain-containing protein n=1 Tax=Botrytis tulipae TaxID=87230 RepID=A0A4Z1EV38_9HELO|nr:hypothetical protein BTUL_0078g00500 [Botrytis tulipae]
MPKRREYLPIPGSSNESQASRLDSDLDHASEKPSSGRHVNLSKILNFRYYIVALVVCICFMFGFISGFHSSPSIRRPYTTGHGTTSSCVTQDTRREWRSLSHLEKDAYISAVQCLPTQPSILNLPHTLYDDFAWVHTHKGDETLDTAGFFPWHRYFILSYEKILRKQCNYTGSMPYWDWTLDWTDFHSSPLWDPHTGFGGSGNTSAAVSVGRGHCVTDGPFTELRPLYYDRDIQQHCLSRAFRTGETLELAMSKISPAAVEAVLARQDYQNFTFWLEKDTHKSMPYVIQGEWMRTSVTNDPIWFLAHMQLDRLWWIWQSRNPETRFYEFHGVGWGGSNQDASRSDKVDIGGLLPSITVEQLLRTDSDIMCYNSDNRTFRNCYWLNDTFYRPGGPVFFFDTGEHGISEFMVSMLLEEAMGRSALMALAQKYNGLAILWEHRFYGASLPFELENKTGVALAGFDAYKYLTTEQVREMAPNYMGPGAETSTVSISNCIALEDTVYFARNFQPSTLRKYWLMLSPSNTPWIFIGGSYPGIRAAIARQRNPEIWFASWASSAPVQAQVDMSVYFNPIQQAMTDNCSKDVHIAVDYADKVFQYGSRDEVLLLRQEIYMTGRANPAINKGLHSVDNFPLSPTDMTLWEASQILATPFQHTSHNFQLYGFDSALLSFCNYLEQYDPSASVLFPHSASANEVEAFRDWIQTSHSSTSTRIGIAATYNASTAFFAYISAIYRKMADDYSDQGSGFSLPPSSLGDGVSWKWQYCSEFGFLQSSNTTNPFNLISRFDNISSEESNICADTFPYAPQLPNVSAINDKYGGWKMAPSNVMFSNGEMDPWRTLGVQADLEINPNAVIRKSTKTIPTCNIPPPNGEVFGQVYPAQVHISDLLSSFYIEIEDQPSPFEAGFDLFTKALNEWLPCFNGLH